MAWKIAWVALGGACGATSRFLVTELMRTAWSTRFPWRTMTVNLLGCLVMGFLFALTQKKILTNEPAKLFLMVGFLGSFTTFSSFALDNSLLLQEETGIRLSMLLNIGVQNIAGLLLVLAGVWCARFV